MTDMPVERMHPHLPKGYAYVEFENPDEAKKALKHMDGGQIDGREDHCHCCAGPLAQATHRRVGPPRRMLPLSPTWRRSPRRLRRRSRSPRRRQVPRPLPSQEPLQLQLLLISRATEAPPLGVASHPTHFCHFSSRRRISRKEIPHSGAGFKGEGGN